MTRSTSRITVAACVCIMGLSIVAAGQQGSESASAADSLVGGGLEVGTRMLAVVLLEDSRGDPVTYEGSFVGSVTKLKEDQDLAPFRPFVQYKFIPYFGLGVSYDRVAAEAWDHGGTDGTTELTGPMVYVIGCYANASRFTPFCELGMVWYSVTFDEDSGWDKYDRKSFDLDDTEGVYAAIGCDVRLFESWAIDFYGRYVNVDVDGVYTLDGRQRDDILFTMSHLSLGLGAKYSF